MDKGIGFEAERVTLLGKNMDGHDAAEYDTTRDDI